MKKLIVLSTVFFVAMSAVLSPGLYAQDSIEEIVVTGSNIQRTGYSAISPVQVKNRDEMLAEGAKTITDFAINLPVNIGSEFQTESGDLIGTAQSGTPLFFFANLEAQGDLMEIAHSDARKLILEDPKLQGDRGRAARVLLWLMEKNEVVKLLKVG